MSQVSELGFLYNDHEGFEHLTEKVPIRCYGQNASDIGHFSNRRKRFIIVYPLSLGYQTRFEPLYRAICLMLYL